ncbi:peptidoglycan-binding protein [Streptomyces sp. NPDC046805]|uniref:peptidoglycan-binding protein n=1 Tax=Streptomyces sp. NPDC046805 TaxID=3155134 RepID=UPI0033DF22A7
MTTPVFEDIDPASDCDCPGCAHWRRVSPLSLPGRFGGHPAARRVLVVAAATSAALGVGHAVPAFATPPAPGRPGVPADPDPETPQGAKSPLHGGGGSTTPPTTTPATTRTEIINRAKKWVTAKVPYSMSKYWSDGYRQDCSGFVSMAWGLPSNEWTGSLGGFGVKIKKEELQPGDILLFHNPDNPEKGSHVVLFGGWTDYTHTYYTAYEQTPPHARRLATPYAYWSNSSRYVPYRYKGVPAGTAGAEPDVKAAPFPGASYFGPGADNKYVTQLGEMLIARGAGAYYTQGPGPRWSDADRRATQAFQLAQGWTGAAADGLPGPETWDLLVTGKGKDIKRAAVGSSPSAASAPSTLSTPSTPSTPSTSSASRAVPASHGVAGYPGRGMFRPGSENPYVTQLRKQLAKKGFGAFYADGPGPRWGEADRRAVGAFQRSQGWRGGAVDGYPGPETWRRLFA